VSSEDYRLPFDTAPFRREAGKPVVNLFDVFVVVVTIGLAVLGFREGLVRGAIKLAGFLFVLFLLGVFAGEIVGFAGGFHGIPRQAAVPLVFLLFLVLGTVLVHVLAHFVHKLVHMTPVGFIDNGLGCAFGILKALLLCGLAAFLLSFAPPGSFPRNEYESSRSAEFLAEMLLETIPFVRKYAPLGSPDEKRHHDTIPRDYI